VEYLRVFREIKKRKYDVSIELRGSFFNIFLLQFLPKIKYRIGFYNAFVSKYLLHFPYKRDMKKHETVLINDLLYGGFGIESKEVWPEISTDEEDSDKVKTIIKENKLSEFVCIIPESSSEKKQWPLTKYDSIIKFLEKRHPELKRVLVGIDEGKAKWLQKRNSGIIAFTELGLREVYLLFKKSELVISPDGGLMHLAWAAKTNLIALIPDYIGLENICPLGKKSRVIHKSMKEITVEDVKKEINRILKKDKTV
jgi:ADP-heptose:LPS heptosyltransferase